ncbi:MAG: tRNA preQ1(34) S-adenosylmethionine ribosyltransferase-isomerase QueA [Deltaproteobacteria bacterium]|nr:tRNA preQ1(34) S-adenosylmethionine ribosyltransferase-isomerase QueA [Deltaproteobacteria bacterium]
MDIKDFDYNLPQNLIAQHPLKDRDASRLMALDRATGKIEHRVFRDIKDYVTREDGLALNDTKVIPARLLGRKKTGGTVELFLVRPTGVQSWLCMMKNSKGLKPGGKIYFAKGIEAEALGKTPDELWECRFNVPSGRGNFYEEIGSAPLPPYIKRRPIEDDKNRYQTEFAKIEGAVAAPTAGLHFTKGLLDDMAARGVSLNYITLHVGPGTFLPVKTQDITLHKMHKEFYSIAPEVFAALIETKKRGHRIIAAGTTALRAIEASVRAGVERPVLTGYTDLFIYQGFEFRMVDALITNFHLPRSTLLMLAAAFAGRENILNAYSEAVKEKYRFFSYGDAMLII